MTNEAVLWTKYSEANARFRRNAHKLAWMDATRRMGAEVIHYGSQLAAYRDEAKKAAVAFSAATRGKTAEEVAAIIEEAEA
jgi:hypothetical protein